MGPFSEADYADIGMAEHALKEVLERSTCPRNRVVMALRKMQLQLGGLVLQGRVEKAMRDAPKLKGGKK